MAICGKLPGIRNGPFWSEASQECVGVCTPSYALHPRRLVIAASAAASEPSAPSYS